MSAPLPNLDVWLYLATYNLATPAQERIRQEIESHFRETVEAYQAEGWSELQAQTQALSDLGDPHEAAMRFRKFHLTIKEAKRLEEACRQRRNECRFWWVSVPFLLLIGVLFRLGESGLLATYMITITVLPTIDLLVVRHRPNKSFIRHLYVFDAVQWFTSLTFFVLAVRLDWTGVLNSGALFFAFLLGDSINLVRKIPLWLKLNRMDDFSRELPPPGTVS